MDRMTRWICVLVLAATISDADVIHLKDGSVKEGKILEKKDGVVVLQVTAGNLSANLRIPESDIQQVEEKPLPQDVFQEKEAKIAGDDANGWCQLGIWAEENNLPEKAKTAFGKALQIDPNNVAAAKRLDYVQLEGKWMSKDDALGRMEGMYKEGKFDAVYQMLSPLKEVPNEAMRRRDLRGRVLRLYGLSCERLSKWDEALQAWRRVSQVAADRKERAFATARIAVLEGHPDGQFSCSGKDLPKSLLDNDPKAAALAKEETVKSLSDESVMDLAMKVYAFKILEEVKGQVAQIDKIESNAEAAYDKWKAALGKVQTADHVLSGVAKDLRMEVLKKGLAYHESVLQGVSHDLDQKAPVGSPQAFQGDVAEAQRCLDCSKGLLTDYEGTLNYLSGLEEKMPEEVSRFQNALESEQNRCSWLEGQVDVLNIRQHCAELEIEYRTVMNSANAFDPRRQEFTVEEGDGYFTDSGKSWRRHTAASFENAKKAYSILKEILADYRKKPEVFSAEIQKTQEQVLQCDEFIKAVVAGSDRKGVTIRGWCPW